jgi:oxygen-independent coproporphyrinogen-3 oxidase
MLKVALLEAWSVNPFADEYPHDLPSHHIQLAVPFLNTMSDAFPAVKTDSNAASAASLVAPVGPRGAYLHLPFCRHRCGYRNFTVVAGRDDLIASYLTAIARELATLGCPRPVDTLFFGGGTPTHLPAAQLRELLAIARHWFPLAHGGEFSVEANPADLSPEKVDVLHAAGVTRISLGVQSFDVKRLALLERDHDAAIVAASVALARQAAASVSLDLIFACPEQSLADWQRELRQALDLAPDHISTYGLTFEKGTNFWSRRADGRLAECDEELQREHYEAAIDELTAAGFEHYEISNFARPGHRCRHNEMYWRGDEFFAAGPGASRYVGGRRETNHRSTTTYLARVSAGESPVAEIDELSAEDRARERLVFGLRRIAGVDRVWFRRATGFDADALCGAAIKRYRELELIADDGATLRLTRAGLLVSDAMWPDFLA